MAWAERHGLRLSTAGCCPLWLGREDSQRCHHRAPCTRYGSDRGWMDHTVTGLKDSRPAVITSAPYHVYAQDKVAQ